MRRRKHRDYLPVEPQVDGRAVQLAADAKLGWLAEQINLKHRECQDAWESAAYAARDAGRLLLQAKQRAGHGNWASWLEQNFEGTARTAQRYMQIADSWEQIEQANTTRVSDLDGHKLSIRGALKLLVEAGSEESEPVEAEFVEVESGAEWTPEQAAATIRFAHQFGLGDRVEVIRQCPVAFLRGLRAQVADVLAEGVMLRLEEHPLGELVRVEPQYLRRLEQPGQPRIESDVYPTDGRLLRALLRELPFLLLNGGPVLELCAGRGDLVQELRELRVPVVTNDFLLSLQREQGWDFCRDATKAETWLGFGEFRHCVTNPPFLAATEILEQALEFTPGLVVFLLRLTYLEPAANRVELLRQWSDQLRWVVPVSPRPDFRGDGGADRVTVAWFVWDKDWSWREMGLVCPWLWITNWKEECDGTCDAG